MDADRSANKVDPDKLFLFLNVHCKQPQSCRDGQLTTLFLGRLGPPNLLTSTKCTYFCQLLIIVLEPVERGTSLWPDRVSNLGPLALE